MFDWRSSTCIDRCLCLVCDERFIGARGQKSVWTDYGQLNLVALSNIDESGIKIIGIDRVAGATEFFMTVALSTGVDENPDAMIAEDAF